MILGLQFVTYIRIILVIVTWFFQIRRFFPFLVIVTWHFHIWKFFLLFNGFVEKVIVSWFQIQLFRKRRNNQMAAVMLEAIPSLYTNYSKSSLFISANAYENNIVSKEYCIARHDDKLCFLPNCRYHIILTGNIKDSLQKLDTFCFNYQHVDCSYKFSNYASVAKLF